MSPIIISIKLQIFNVGQSTIKNGYTNLGYTVLSMAIAGMSGTEKLPSSVPRLMFLKKSVHRYVPRQSLPTRFFSYPLPAVFPVNMSL